MLLPALSRAKDVAKGIVCTGNLKQCGTALTMYAGDNGGWCETYNESYNPWWSNATESYLGIPDGSTRYPNKRTITWCPARTPYDVVDNSATAKLFGYGTEYFYTNDRVYRQVGVSRAIRMTFISDPSNFIALADASYRMETNANLLQINLWCKATGIWDPAAIIERHGGQANAFFADGSAGIITSEHGKNFGLTYILNKYAIPRIIIY